MAHLPARGMRNFGDRARFEAEMTLAERLPERSILDVFIAAAAIRPDRVAITQVEVRRLGADGSLGDVCGTGEIGVIAVCSRPGTATPSTTRVSSRARSASAERTMRLAVSRGARVLAAEPRAIAEQPGRRADPALDHFGSARDVVDQARRFARNHRRGLGVAGRACRVGSRRFAIRTIGCSTSRIE